MSYRTDIMQLYVKVRKGIKEDVKNESISLANYSSF